MSEALHVLLPTDVFPPVCGGAGWSAHALARALQERGHRVTAIVPREVRAGIPLSGLNAKLTPAAPHDVLGVPTVEAPYRAPRLPFVANWYRHEWLWPLVRNVIIREALRATTDHRPLTTTPRGHPRRLTTVIHAQHVQTLPGAVLAGRELAVPVVATVRDHWPRDYFATGLHGGRLPYPTNSPASLATDLVARLGPLKGVLAIPAIPYMLGHLRRRQFFLSQADAVVAVSRYVARLLPPAVPPERVHVIPNLVDVAAIQRTVATPPASQLDAPFVLFAGKLERNKGVHLLPGVMAAARAVLGDQPLPELVVAGDGALAGELEREFSTMGYPLRILPGWTDHDEVLRLMHRAEVLLFPSAWGEPLSRVPLEASAAGACIAAMPTGGTSEAMQDGVNGLLAPDAAALGHALATLLRDPDLRARLRAGALRTAREQWAPEVVAGAFEALYRQIFTLSARPANYAM